MKIKAPKDFWAGLMFIAFGVAFMLVARNYAMGTAVRMGPAYFPTLLGGLLALLGLVIFLKSFVTQGTVLTRLYVRPNVFVLGAVVLWALLLKPLGLVIATAALIFVSSLGGHDFRWKQVAILYAVLATFSVLVFIKGLGLPLPIWPGE